MIKTVVAGLGKRGEIHLSALLRNAAHFQVVGIYDPYEPTLQKISQKYGLQCVFHDLDDMLQATKPDLFVFVTHPDIRLEIVKKAAAYHIKAISLEKPLATSLKEAKEIASLCEAHHIKAIVCHQHKYLEQMLTLDRYIRIGAIGEIEKIHATTQAWTSQLGTHYMDYALWAARGARALWCTGHIHGRAKLSDNHPSPDYLLGKVMLDTGIPVYIENGYLSPAHLTEEKFWFDDRITVYGSKGYVWCDSDNCCCLLSEATNGKVQKEVFPFFKEQEENMQRMYYADLAEWIYDDTKVHPCNIEISYHGLEILTGIYLSALDHTRVDIPLREPQKLDMDFRLYNELPAVDYTGRLQDLPFFRISTQKSR